MTTKCDLYSMQWYRSILNCVSKSSTQVWSLYIADFWSTNPTQESPLSTLRDRKGFFRASDSVEWDTRYTTCYSWVLFLIRNSKVFEVTVTFEVWRWPLCDDMATRREVSRSKVGDWLVVIHSISYIKTTPAVLTRVIINLKSILRGCCGPVLVMLLHPDFRLDLGM